MWKKVASAYKRLRCSQSTQLLSACVTIAKLTITVVLVWIVSADKACFAVVCPGILQFNANWTLECIRMHFENILNILLIYEWTVEGEIRWCEGGLTCTYEKGAAATESNDGGRQKPEDGSQAWCLMIDKFE
ncbi:hypothetical protein C8R44DRAFT_930239 [Mycena epipterygia]|nr:hypothetical protein C8R44DRAFT_930239 [Mycena epipterygia]